MKHPVDIEEICRIGVEENLKRIKVNDIIRVIDPDYFQCFACNRWKHRDDLTTNRISKNSKMCDIHVCSTNCGLDGYGNDQDI